MRNSNVPVIATDQDGFDLLDAMMGVKDEDCWGMEVTEYTEEEFYRYNE